MTDKQFIALWQEAGDSTDQAAFLAAEKDAAPEDQLKELYEARHRSMRDIAAAAGLSHRKLAERFCIPYRTMESWCSGARTPPDWVRLLIQEALGLVHR